MRRKRKYNKRKVEYDDSDYEEVSKPYRNNYYGDSDLGIKEDNSTNVNLISFLCGCATVLLIGIIIVIIMLMTIG